jgi:hypothetical protein
LAGEIMPVLFFDIGQTLATARLDENTQNCFVEVLFPFSTLPVEKANRQGQWQECWCCPRRSFSAFI